MTLTKILLIVAYMLIAGYLIYLREYMMHGDIYISIKTALITVAIFAIISPLIVVLLMKAIRKWGRSD